jgi:hypothetical protein
MRTNTPGVIDFTIVIHDVVEGFCADPSPHGIQSEGILKSLAKGKILERVLEGTCKVYGLNSPGVV